MGLVAGILSPVVLVAFLGEVLGVLAKYLFFWIWKRFFLITWNYNIADV